VTLKPIIILSALVGIALTVFFSCNDPNIVDGSGVELSFSTDTVRFDTVFTARGSVTLPLKVYNDSKDAVTIDRVRLSGSPSFFRFNVDGLPGPVVEDAIIWPEDSIYVFIEVTIDPDLPPSESPFVIEENIEFYTGDVRRDVLLQAWGQNANYIPSLGAKNSLALLSCDLNQVNWDDPKPYVVYGILLVDSCTLQIPEGARVYFHGGLANNELGIYRDGGIFFLDRGRLEVNGTPDRPVLFASDRIEPSFSQIPGQWPGLRFLTGSRDNRISHAIIEHAEVGVRVDSAAEVDLKAVEIRYCSGQGILGIHSSITADNCLVHNTGAVSMQIAYGGSVTSRYSSYASYGNTSEALGMNNFFCYDPPLCNSIGVNALNATFTNCIFNGNERDEIGLFDITEQAGDFNYLFRNSLVKVDDLLDVDNFPDFFDNCLDCVRIEFGDPVFLDEPNDDFRLDTMSLARDIGLPIPGISADIIGMPRDPVQPDAGCYELLE
jgi:hypothetical protein